MARATLGFGSDSATWKAGMDLYYQDKVEAALEVVHPSAGSFQGTALRTYRLIEGEARTRHASQRRALAPTLELEWVAEEVPHDDAVGGTVLGAASKVTKRLRWDKHESVLATILVSEADADWHESRYGYCVDKVPYDKICLPHVSTENQIALFRVAAHEFAHVVVLNTAENLAPHWLDEGIACLMEGRNPVRSKMRLDEWNAWLPPLELNAAFEVDRRSAANSHGVGAAYDQATVLVAYLHSLKGDEGLVALLNALPDHSKWQDVLRKLVSGDPVDTALRRSHDFGQEELFARAKAWYPQPQQAL